MASHSRNEEKEEKTVQAQDEQPDAAEPGLAASRTSSPAPSEDENNDESTAAEQPPLPDEDLPPPLPEEPEPEQSEDDGWQPMWDQDRGAYYFYNRITGLTQWENPRIPEAAAEQNSAADAPAGTGAAGTYNPKIHGSWDPNADYAKALQPAQAETPQESVDQEFAAQQLQTLNDYGSTGHFNRFSGRFQNTAVHDPSQHTADARAGRQLNGFFDYEAAANAHDGRSLKEERRNHKPSQKEVRRYNQQRRDRKEKKRRDWLMS